MSGTLLLGGFYPIRREQSPWEKWKTPQKLKHDWEDLKLDRVIATGEGGNGVVILRGGESMTVLGLDSDDKDAEQLGNHTGAVAIPLGLGLSWGLLSYVGLLGIGFALLGLGLLEEFGLFVNCSSSAQEQKVQNYKEKGVEEEIRVTCPMKTPGSASGKEKEI